MEFRLLISSNIERAPHRCVDLKCEISSEWSISAIRSEMLRFAAGL